MIAIGFGVWATGGGRTGCGSKKWEGFVGSRAGVSRFNETRGSSVNHSATDDCDTGGNTVDPTGRCQGS